MGMAKKYGFSVLIVCFVLFSLAPTLYELSRAWELKPERTFELVHNFPTDYNFYLSRIREGLEGRWTVVEKYTSEPHTGGFIHGFYLLLGRIGRMSGVPLGRESDVYHVARVVLGVALLVAVAEFCKKIWEDKGHMGYWGIIAFLLAVTASSWPKLVAVVDTKVVSATLENITHWRLGGYMSWWSVMDSLQRITFIPHILAGQVLIVILVLLLTSPSTLTSGINILFMGILGFVLGLVFPPGLLFVYTVMAVWVVLAKGRFRSWLAPYGLVVLVSVSSLVYLALMTSMYPWKRLAEVDIIRPLPFEYVEYAKAVGVIGVIGVIGGIWVMIKREKTLYPAVAWVIAWGALLGIFAFVPQQSPLRFSEMAPQVPLGVLSAYLLLQLSHARYVRDVSKMIVITLISLGLFHMYSSYLWQKDFIDHKIRATLPLVPTGSYVMYPLKDFVSAMVYLWDATKGEGVILSETTAGNYIPAYTGNFVYAGHDNTVAFEAKKHEVKEFFSGRMNASEARAWVRTTRARYVFFGPQEQEDGGITDLRIPYPFLEEVYKNEYVRIYKVP